MFPAFFCGHCLKWEADGELHGAEGVAAAAVEVIPILQADGADQGVPGKAAAHGLEYFVGRVIGDLPGKANGVNKCYGG